MKNKEGLLKHLREHIKWPATKQELADACNKMSDIAEEDRETFRKNLPDGTYKDADEVAKALKLQ